MDAYLRRRLFDVTVFRVRAYSRGRLIKTLQYLNYLFLHPKSIKSCESTLVCNSDTKTISWVSRAQRSPAYCFVVIIDLLIVDIFILI